MRLRVLKASCPASFSSQEATRVALSQYWVCMSHSFTLMAEIMDPSFTYLLFHRAPPKVREQSFFFFSLDVLRICVPNTAGRFFFTSLQGLIVVWGVPFPPPWFKR